MSCLPLGLSSAWAVFRLGSLRRLMLWFLRNVARNSPTCISNVEIAPLEFCGFLDTYEKLGYPNYVRVLVDEAPEASSCVHSSSHDTVHDPRDTSNTTSYTLKCEEPLNRQPDGRSHQRTPVSAYRPTQQLTRGRHGAVVEQGARELATSNRAQDWRVRAGETPSLPAPRSRQCRR